MRIQENAPAVAGDSLEVSYEDRLVGPIRRRTEAVQDIEFAYDEAWMSDPNGFPVSTRMPLSRRLHEPDVVYTWFLNLLPEGRTRQTIGAILCASTKPMFSLFWKRWAKTFRGRSRDISPRRRKAEAQSEIPEADRS
ncbi:HipA N-terminal domain-containing protein [Bradyrhizobium sp. BEA-2-5]|uniref:HipA N-terminal domain-containing protein n=1 Tax=Bradyrhizobium sp. BEA-2-5 TaxID=3080015 RepID=UPI00293F6D1D|nr:HipA N-terminal domain-containing protein [Bradyrhizobium sp. BEA-2-5]WOH80351.1 HipA N-terminal domain-containing protein [Bradyrhizobium sp. BEA-2-5]